MSAEQLELFYDQPFSVRLRMSEAIRIFRANYWDHLPSAKTTTAHFSRIERFFKDHFMDTVSKADIERFRRHLKEMGYSDATINKSHMIISRLYRKFEEYKEGRYLNGEDFSKINLPTRNPASLVPKVNERKFARKVVVTKAQITKLISYSDESLAETIKALYWTRLRPSDLSRITRSNVDFKNMVITGIQNKTITTKNPSGVPYRVAMSDEIAALVMRRIESFKPGAKLFPFKAVRFRWKRVRELAEMPWLQLRDLRRSAASHLLDVGIDPQTVADGLGHTTLRMLPNYTPRTDKHLLEASEKLSGV